MSGGAIAGIAVGALVGIVLVIAAVWLLFKRRGRARGQTQPDHTASVAEKRDPDGGLYEAPDTWRPHEAPVTVRHEVHAVDKPAEIGGSGVRHEMSGVVYK